MNTNQVDCFLSAARHLSFSAAAGELFLSPQAVSKQVITLERELDVRLFDRNGPRLRLTEAGAMYRRLFEGQVRQYAFLREDILLHQRSLGMSLRLGVSEWLDPFGSLGEGILAFTRQHRQANFSLYCHTNTELLAALQGDDVDCAFFSGGQRPDRRDLEAVPVAAEDILLYAPEDLGGGAAREDCWGLPMLMTLAWDWIFTEYRLLGVRERLMTGLAPAELVTLPNYQSLLAEMLHTRGVTLAGSRFTPFARLPGLRGHSLGIRDDIFCLWRKTNENPLLPQLAAFLRGHFSFDAKEPALPGAEDGV